MLNKELVTNDSANIIGKTQRAMIRFFFSPDEQDMDRYISEDESEENKAEQSFN
jgi:hypothetical protein